MGSRWLDTMAVDNADEFFSIIDRHPQVRGILWGHVHQEFDTMRSDVRLMASPSTCIQFLPGSGNFAVDAAAPGYRWLSLYPDGRIETGILRLSEVPGSVDLASAGYK
jgi:Icc protein